MKYLLFEQVQGWVPQIDNLLRKDKKIVINLQAPEGYDIEIKTVRKTVRELGNNEIIHRFNNIQDVELDEDIKELPNQMIQKRSNPVTKNSEDLGGNGGLFWTYQDNNGITRYFANNGEQIEYYARARKIPSVLYESKIRPYYFEINKTSSRKGGNWNPNQGHIETFHPDLHGKAHDKNPYVHGIRIGFEFRYAPLMYFDVPYSHHKYSDYYNSNAYDIDRTDTYTCNRARLSATGSNAWCNQTLRDYNYGGINFRGHHSQMISRFNPQSYGLKTTDGDAGRLYGFRRESTSKGWLNWLELSLGKIGWVYGVVMKGRQGSQRVRQISVKVSTDDEFEDKTFVPLGLPDRDDAAYWTDIQKDREEHYFGDGAYYNREYPVYFSNGPMRCKKVRIYPTAHYSHQSCRVGLLINKWHRPGHHAPDPNKMGSNEYTNHIVIKRDGVVNI